MKNCIGLILAGILPLALHAQLVMTSNYDMVMSKGTAAHPTSLVLTNSSTDGITRTGTGWIISENEFNQVDWNIGTHTGTYVVPFGYSGTDYIPVTFNVTVAGAGNGVVKFSTYHGTGWDNATYEPSDVTNMSDYGATNYSARVVDRFWDVDANTGYTTKPTANLTLSYIRGGGTSEIAAPNTITENDLIAQRFNSTLDQWGDFSGATNTDVTASNTGTVTTGPVTPSDLFRSWALVVDSTLLTTGIQQIAGAPAEITVWPNPAMQTINVKLNQAQEGDAVISIVNVIGQEVIQKQQHINSGTIIPIDVSNLSSAVYFIKISTNGFSATSKFVKQN